MLFKMPNKMDQSSLACKNKIQLECSTWAAILKAKWQWAKRGSNSLVRYIPPVNKVYYKHLKGVFSVGNKFLSRVSSTDTLRQRNWYRFSVNILGILGDMVCVTTTLSVEQESNCQQYVNEDECISMKLYGCWNATFTQFS